ncbi:MAG: metallo-beta-lactamase family protein [Pseudohongiellaceae bacterium]|jgi:metallo-beta-lactamase family protein
MTIALQFLGAARHVTGSKHLLTVNGKGILLDCGMVQGPRRMADKANRTLPFSVGEIDAVVLSHAHIDHSGSLPKLVKDGYSGPIHCTEPTADMLEIMLADSAYIQFSDARHLGRRGIDFEPIYDQDDVAATLTQVVGKPYHESFEVLPGVRVTFLDAGHILGSALVVLDVDDGKHKLRIGFTGDHGRKDLPILRDCEQFPELDVLITESTYGDRLHDSNVDMQAALEDVVNHEQLDGGRILIPAFSVGRTQNVVLSLGMLLQQGRIDELPIWVDSPLSRKSTAIMANHSEVFDKQTRALIAGGHSPFFFDGVRYVASVDESKALNDEHVGVIVSSSGMCEAGRILHHLARSVGNPRDCVLMVGYQAEGTLGRRLIEGVKEVKIYGKTYDVRCQVRSIGGFSAHADWRELIEAYGHLGPHLERTFVVHGEEGPATTHAERLTELGFKNVAVHVQGQRFVLRD